MRRIGSGVGVGGIGGGGGVGGIGGGGGGGSGGWRRWAARARWEASSFSSNGGGGERIRGSRVSIFTGQANILRAKQNLHWPTKI
jgi:hypothetical protein